MKVNHIQKTEDNRKTNEDIQILKKPKRPDGGYQGTAIFEEFFRINLIHLDELKKRKIKEKFFYLDIKMNQQENTDIQETIAKVEKLEREIQIIDNAVSAWVLIGERYIEVLSYHSSLSAYYKNQMELMAFFNRKFMKNAG
jgi:CRISPR/Cas system-associated endonuclease Cas3-HD